MSAETAADHLDLYRQLTKLVYAHLACLKNMRYFQNYPTDVSKVSQRSQARQLHLATTIIYSAFQG